MARIPRIVIPQVAHHVTQRGNRRQRTFFSNEDYETYLRMMGESCRTYNVEIWSYCLMPNHIHLIAVPKEAEALAKAIGQGHEAYSRYFNFKNKWRGYLWQGRFHSFPMDDTYLLLAARYIEINPVAAKFVTRPHDYEWSSARAHLELREDAFVNHRPLLDRVENWFDFLQEGIEANVIEQLEKHEQSGRPLGSELFLNRLELQTGRILRPQKRGPKPIVAS